MIIVSPPLSLPTCNFSLNNNGDAKEGCVSSSPAGLRRKRPARIDIPTPCLDMEWICRSSDEDVVGRLDEIEFEGDVFSVYCKRGRKGPMEDRYSAAIDLHEDHHTVKHAIFGIFDGHGGDKAAEFAARNLGDNIMHAITTLRSNENDAVEAAVREAYLTTDEEFLKQNVNGGACCVTAVVHEGNLVVSNAGDCRAVMSRGGVAEALSVDHRPSRDDERRRIESLGGYVNSYHDVWRIQGSLAVTRGIGDSHMKEFVIAEPETRKLLIESDCEFLILASDGVWEKIENQEAVDIVRGFCMSVDEPKQFFACKELVELAVKRGSIDDASAMVILLNCFFQ